MEIGLNPHSNGILFSRLIFLFIGKNLFKLKVIIEINMINNINNINTCLTGYAKINWNLIRDNYS